MKIFLDTGEFLAFGLYFLLLGSFSARYETDTEQQTLSKTWAYIEFILFIFFTAIFFIVGTEGLIYQVFGGLYLLSLIVAITLTIRMNDTIEAI